MSKKKLIILVSSIALVLALVLSACAQQAGLGVPPLPVQDRVYRALNPTGIFIPVEAYGLSPRLDSLAGKKILYYQSEANPVIMPYLLEQLKKEFPSATFTCIVTENQGEDTPTEEQMAGTQAVIRGISW